MHVLKGGGSDVEALVYWEGGKDLPELHLFLRGGPGEGVCPQIEMRKEVEPACSFIQYISSVCGTEDFS